MSTPIYIPVEVSARHVHLSAHDLAILFGKTHPLVLLKDISQPGQYAAKETVMLQAPHGSIEHVRVVGPLRSVTQVELARSDALRLGIDPPVRRSGELKSTPGLTLIGPAGKVKLRQGVIIAQRHVHCDPEHAELYHLRDGQLVDVRIRGLRDITFHQVIVRVDPRFVWRIQIDTDEANAAWLRGGDLGEVIISAALASAKRTKKK